MRRRKKRRRTQPCADGVPCTMETPRPPYTVRAPAQEGCETQLGAMGHPLYGRRWVQWVLAHTRTRWVLTRLSPTPVGCRGAPSCPGWVLGGSAPQQ